MANACRSIRVSCCDDRLRAPGYSQVERYFAWLRFFRRLVTRYEVKAENFLGFLHLACALILMRQF
ncbi:hypothetical protein D7V77_39060 [Corallococcus sp. CA041A]|nr:hypothetical protein D7V77_39060 [Corallococcus sp. CA041A]